MRTQAHVDYVQELRANQGMRLWIDRDPPRARVPTRASTRQATEQPAVHTAARGIDVSFMPSPPQHIDGRCRVSKTSVQQRGSPTDSSSYTENDDSNRTNSSRRSSNKRLMNASPCAHARSKARNRSPPESQTGGGLAFLTHFFME